MRKREVVDVYAVGCHALLQSTGVAPDLPPGNVGWVISVPEPAFRLLRREYPVGLPAG